MGVGHKVELLAFQGLCDLPGVLDVLLMEQVGLLCITTGGRGRVARALDELGPGPLDDAGGNGVMRHDEGLGNVCSLRDAHHRPADGADHSTLHPMIVFPFIEAVQHTAGSVCNALARRRR